MIASGQCPPPAQPAAVLPDLLGDHLRQDRAGCGGQGLVRRRLAQFVVAQPQRVAQRAEHSYLIRGFEISPSSGALFILYTHA